jgi:biotin-[acetyl-CoA-carboxylase] ligase BirA-like protein
MKEYERLIEAVGHDGRWVVRAGCQTEGRGRGDNLWQSPLDGLWLTCGLDFPEAVPSFALYVGYCLHRLLQHLYGLPGLQVKWPNDLYLDGRKLGGILCQYKGNISHYIIGIGLNTNNSPGSVGAEFKAVNLSGWLGFEVSNSRLAELIPAYLEANIALLTTPENYISYCGKHLFGKGLRAELENHGRRESIVVESIAPDGSLLARGPDGTLASFNYGSLIITG